MVNHGYFGFEFNNVYINLIEDRLVHFFRKGLKWLTMRIR